MMMEASGGTYPEAGVIATNPATAPDAAPSTVGLPRMAHSENIHPSAAAAAAVLVTTKALVASLPAVRALPALKPNHPNQRSAAPATVRGRGWGGGGGGAERLRPPTPQRA